MWVGAGVIEANEGLSEPVSQQDFITEFRQHDYFGRKWIAARGSLR